MAQRIRVFPAVQICTCHVVSNYQPFQFEELQALFWPTYTHRCVDTYKYIHEHTHKGTKTLKSFSI